jgi:[acyl-carrier-protein] S-malonyltransferase
MFPGQGSQFAGMGRSLCSTYAVARDTYQHASHVLGFDLLRACDNDRAQMSSGRLSNPAIVVYSIASLRVLIDETGVQPSAACGHSMGEISALVCAGALGFEDAVRLAEERARLMARCPPGVMSVVFGLPVPVVEAVCRDSSAGVVVVANKNSADQCVLSGEPGAVESVGKVLVARSAIVRPIQVPVAAHSPLMEPAMPHFRVLVEGAGIRDAAIPVVSAASGCAMESAADLVASLCAQLTSCVDWSAAIAGMTGIGVQTFVDVGPKTVLRDLTLENQPGLVAVACDGQGGIGAVTDRLRADGTAAVRPSAADVAEFLRTCLMAAVGTPSLADLPDAEFEAGVRARYNSLRAELGQARAGVGYSVSEVVELASCATAMLKAKGVAATAASAVLRNALAGRPTLAALTRHVSGFERRADALDVPGVGVGGANA